MRKFLIPLLCGAGLLGGAALALEDRVLDLPSDYRDTFTQYYSNDRLLADEQTITLFANDVALNGVQADGKLPVGSVLIAEIYAAQKDGDGDVIESALGHRIPGEFKAIALMERRDGWDDQYPDELKVGNWEFELFSADGKNLGKDTTGCRECHHPLTDTEFLFSIEHLAAAKK